MTSSSLLPEQLLAQHSERDTIIEGDDFQNKQEKLSNKL